MIPTSGAGTFPRYACGFFADMANMSDAKAALPYTTPMIRKSHFRMNESAAF